MSLSKRGILLKRLRAKRDYHFALAQKGQTTNLIAQNNNYVQLFSDAIEMIEKMKQQLALKVEGHE